MKLKNRIKRSTKQYIIVAGICIVVIGGAALSTALVITHHIKKEYHTLLTNAYHDMELKQRSVYLAASDINAGEIISQDKLKKEKVYSSQPQDTYFTEKDIGKLSLIPIAAETQILSSMVTDPMVSLGLRELEYEVITLNSNIISNDTVDVRIIYPNGESFVVLSKKVVKGIEAGSATCYLWLDEDEILRMSAAIVDAVLYTGSRLITSKYIQPTIQEASQVTYIPNIAILTLLESDPNILARSSQALSKEVRKSLENRLAASFSTDVTSINWNVPSYLTQPIETEDSQQNSHKSTQESSEESINTEDAAKAASEDNIPADALGDLGQGPSSEDFFYYAQEQEAMEADTEYGE